MEQNAVQYQAGTRVNGRIINVYQGHVVVELREGKIGVISGGASQRQTEIGTTIDVIVERDTADGLILAFAPDETAGGSAQEAPEGRAAGGSAQEAPESRAAGGRSFGAWQKLPAGHEKAVAALRELRDCTGLFGQRLKEARQEWQSARVNSQQIYESDVKIAKLECEQEQLETYQEHINNDAKEWERKGRMDAMVKAAEAFVNAIPAKGTMAARGQADLEMERVRELHFNGYGASNAVLAALGRLQECRKAEAERTRNEKLDRVRKEQIERDTASERAFQEKSRRICEEGNRDLAAGFEQKVIRGFCQTGRSLRFRAAGYECPSEVPDEIVFGEIGLAIPVNDPDMAAVVQAVEQQAAEAGEKQNGSYVVRLPYTQRLTDGISLLMRYAPADRGDVQKQLQPLLLKLFLSFPAGKLEATMIDPLELGASFSMIPKLAEGPNSARIIDTKIWSKERDIEEAVAALRQRLENLTQSYGTDRESRLKKEVVRALAITDFPTGFSASALSDLQAIVRNSASLGVCVLICANENGLEELRQKNPALADEIGRSMVVTKASGDRLMLVGPGMENLFLQLDDMSDVWPYQDQIFSQISNAVDRAQLKVEHFQGMFREDIYDSNQWFTGNHDEIAIPIGIRGADTVVRLVLGRGGGSTEHHVLIAGPTGAGKSTLLHTLILSALISYSPDELQMYLLDFKEGVEFAPYTRYRLPSLRVVAIHSEREFGLVVLKELCAELEERSKYFTRYNVSEINDYMQLPDVPKVPKLLLIFDEIQELFRSREEADSISAQCLSCIGKLVTQGRAMGIHVILACQDFRNCSGLEAYFGQMAVRIAVRGSEDGAASILSAGNSGVRSLQNQPAGSAIYNGGGGAESANHFFQISYIREEERAGLLNALDAYFTDPSVAELYEEMQTRILLTNAEGNMKNCFNRLILDGADSLAPIGRKKDGRGLLLGLGFGKKSSFVPEFQRRNRDNLLMVIRDEEMALALSLLASMSLLYEELCASANPQNALLYIADYYAGEPGDSDAGFDDLEGLFPQQVRLAKPGDTEELIESLYETVLARAEGRLPDTERIFFLFFGIGRAKRLQRGSLYDDGNGSQTPQEQLQKILSFGPKYGVNSIVWSESTAGIQTMLGDRYDTLFDKRIAYRLDEKEMEFLVGGSAGDAGYGKTAVYMDIGADAKNTHFRPFDIPAREWLERYAEVYREMTEEGGLEG